MVNSYMLPPCLNKFYVKTFLSWCLGFLELIPNNCFEDIFFYQRDVMDSRPFYPLFDIVMAKHAVAVLL